MPNDFDVSYLAGQQLLQLAVGENEIILNFENASLTAMTGFDVVFHDTTTTWVPGNPETARSALSLVGQTIAEVRVSSEALLIITFIRGAAIHLKDDSDQFESFTISHEGSTLVV